MQYTSEGVFEDLAKSKKEQEITINFATFVEMTNKALFDDNKLATHRASRRFMERARLQRLGRVELRLDQVTIPEEEYEKEENEEKDGLSDREALRGTTPDQVTTPEEEDEKEDGLSNRVAFVGVPREKLPLAGESPKRLSAGSESAQTRRWKWSSQTVAQGPKCKS